MNVNLEDLGKNYKLRIDYAVGASLLDSWNLLASNQGFAKWFPQLTLEAKKNPQQLLFQEGDFRE
ncbi:ATPase, partial [Streptococcus pyogenes]